MLKIGQSESFWYPVKVTILSEDGQSSSHEFEAKFKRLDREALSRAMATPDDLALLRENLLGWRSVVDDDGNPLPFTDDNREALLNLWPVLPALAKAFVEAHSPEGRAKN